MLSGRNLIDGVWVGSDANLKSEYIDKVFFAQASEQQVDAACRAARRDFRAYAATSRASRSAFLRTIADEIDNLGDEITFIAAQETGLSEVRLVGERGRTTNQLRMFSELIEDTAYLDTRFDGALPDRQPSPRPDLRLTHRPIGPVAVFCASNFPLAFSTAGGDTASALAAGCPVIVKAHAAHAGTSELVSQAVSNALSLCSMPTASFQMLQGAGRVVGQALVQHKDVRGVGFTGSISGGRALFDLCHSRAHPIPFFGELGSINPIFCLPNAMRERASQIGLDWASSLTIGAGQFCTCPGVIIAVRGTDFDKLQVSACAALSCASPQAMLTSSIQRNYVEGVRNWQDHATSIVDSSICEGDRRAGPAAYKIDAKSWVDNVALQEEVFGAAGMFVECEDEAELLRVVEAIGGQLTCTLQLEEGDYALAKEMLPALEEKAGRILCNGVPTGVEVCSAMVHGGPYPASTDVRSTSVGTLAIDRWLRPISFQNTPECLLPEELNI